jgi:hypothetical protein
VPSRRAAGLRASPSAEGEEGADAEPGKRDTGGDADGEGEAGAYGGCHEEREPEADERTERDGQPAEERRAAPFAHRSSIRQQAATCSSLSSSSAVARSTICSTRSSAIRL